MTVIYNEKQSALTIADYDVNFNEIRDTITLVNSQLNQTDVLNNDVDGIITGIDILQNNYLKNSNNLSDIQSITAALLNLDIYSKTQTDQSFLKIEDNLSNVNASIAIDNLQIGNNALRNLNFLSQGQEETPQNTGANGDLFYNYGIFDGFIYDNKTFFDNTDNQVMNFNLTDGVLSNIDNLDNFSLLKTVFNNDYIFSYSGETPYNSLYVFNKNNIKDYKKINRFFRIKDLDVVPEQKKYKNSYFNNNIIAAFIEYNEIDARITYITTSLEPITFNYSLNTEYNGNVQTFNNLVFDVKHSENIFLTTDNYLIKINLRDGVSQDTFLYEERFSLDTAPARDIDICAVDNTYFYYLSTSNLTDIYKVDKITGQVSLYRSFANNVLKIITDQNNNVYVLTTGKLTKIDSQNNQLWVYNITAQTPGNIDFDISFNNEIYIAANDKIVKLDENMNEIFTKNTPGRVFNKICLFPGKFTQGFWDRGI